MAHEWKEDLYDETERKEAAPGVWRLKLEDVNAFFVESESKKGNWVLIDTGFESDADFIIHCAQTCFGEEPPQAIFLTHGHCDHAGSVEKLAELWDVPVYAHPLEIAYITGKKEYPVNDFIGGEEKMAHCKHVDLGHRAVALTFGSGLPGMDGWKWIHTPGLTEGHISFFREKDRVLIAGDAFSTVRQAAQAENGQLLEYLSANFLRAEDSLKYLLQLQPSLALCSHGEPMKGEELKAHMELMINRLDERDVTRGQFAD